MRHKNDTWTETEDNFLKLNYSILGVKECARQIYRTVASVKCRAIRLGVAKTITHKEKNKNTTKFICNVMLNDGDIQPLVVRAISRDEARSYIKEQYGHRTLDVRELAFVDPDMRKDYMGISTNGKFAGVRTTKHVRTKNYI